MGDVLQPRFDGLSIDLYAGKFQGSFDLDSSDAEGQRLDDEAYFVVRTKVKGAAMSETKNGDLQRVNTYTVADVVPIPADVGFKLQTVRMAQLSFQTGLLDADQLREDEDDDERLDEVV